METVKYLADIIGFIIQQPEIGTILDENGISPEITYGQIGVDDYDALIRLHSIFDSIEDVETTPIHKADNGTGYDFTVNTPATIHFFYWK